MREVEREILHAGSAPSDGMPRSSGAGNPTAAKAEKLIERKNEAERNLQAIRQAYEELPDREARLLIRKNLFDHIRMSDIPVHMSESTMKRVRSEYIRCVAKHLGLVRKEE